MMGFKIRTIKKEKTMDKINESLKLRLKMIEGLGKLFYEAPRFNKRSLANAKRDWKSALELFLVDYAFQRLRGFPKYESAAIQALHLVAGDKESPTLEIRENVWIKFLEILGLPKDGKGANVKVNPLWPRQTGSQKPLLDFILELKQYNYNLIYWSEQMLINKKTKTAFDELNRIRGISQKIGTLFLRDIAHTFNIQEDQGDDKIYFQPIDTWVRRGSIVLASKLKGKNDWAVARKLICLAECARISGCLLNAGLWLLGSQIVGSDEYENSLKSPEGMKKHLNTYIEDINYLIGKVDEIVKIAN